MLMFSIAQSNTATASLMIDDPWDASRGQAVNVFAFLKTLYGTHRGAPPRPFSVLDFDIQRSTPEHFFLTLANLQNYQSLKYIWAQGHLRASTRFFNTRNCAAHKKTHSAIKNIAIYHGQSSCPTVPYLRVSFSTISRVATLHRWASLQNSSRASFSSASPPSPASFALLPAGTFTT